MRFFGLAAGGKDTSGAAAELVRSSRDAHRLEFLHRPLFQPLADRLIDRRRVEHHDGNLVDRSAQPKNQRLPRLIDPAAADAIAPPKLILVHQHNILRGADTGHLQHRNRDAFTRRGSDEDIDILSPWPARAVQQRELPDSNQANRFPPDLKRIGRNRARKPRKVAFVKLIKPMQLGLRSGRETVLHLAVAFERHNFVLARQPQPAGKDDDG